MSRFHLAQVNIGRFRAPIDHPLMNGFRSQLDSINALADRTPGFVWRLQTEDGNATAIRPFEDDLMAINMSVWASFDALQQFVCAEAIFAQALDWDSGAGLLAYLRSHRLAIGQGLLANPGLCFAGTPGMSVGRIRGGSVSAAAAPGDIRCWPR